ncbi:hypothetical protein M422DRAFT_122117, partial [Sphaerobolus stellatus SS14]
VYLADKLYKKRRYHNSKLSRKGWLLELLKGNAQLVTNLSNLKVAEHFQGSGDTISRYLFTYVKLPDENTPVPLEIESNLKHFPFFKDCLGAFDGTHIDCHPPTDD